MADEQNKPDLTKAIVGIIGVAVMIWSMGAWFGFW